MEDISRGSRNESRKEDGSIHLTSDDAHLRRNQRNGASASNASHRVGAEDSIPARVLCRVPHRGKHLRR